jgi:alpha-glucosidase
MLHWADGQGRTAGQDRGTSAYFTSPRTGAVRHYLQRDRAERYYGLGDKTGPLNLHGRRCARWRWIRWATTRRTATRCTSTGPSCSRAQPMARAWGIYYDTLCACTFDLGCEHDNYHDLFRYIEIDDGDLDYYLMAGSTPAEVIAQFVRLIGGTHLPPRWSLGYAQTAMGLADAPDAQQQLDSFITRIESEGIPCSSFHYGSGYSSRGKRRYVFTWNGSKFPDPKTLNARFHASGMHVVANIKPCLLDDHPAFDEVRAQGGFIHDAHSGQPVIEQFWDGVGSHLDFTQPAVVAWWQNSLKSPGAGLRHRCRLERQQRIRRHGRRRPLARLRPAAADAPRAPAARPADDARQLRGPAGPRPGNTEPVYSVTRAGPPGPAALCADLDRRQHHQLGHCALEPAHRPADEPVGHVQHRPRRRRFRRPHTRPELFVRWVQACCLNPRMVMNSWKADGTTNVPWLHPEVTPHVAAAIRLRYLLMPYLWSLFEQAHHHHAPIIRPTFYDFPDDDACYADCDDFMLGDALLVAPVVEAGATTRTVYLPRGPAAWYDFATGQRFEAGNTHTVSAPLGTLPLFARAGAAIPVAERADGRAQHDDPVTGIRRFG